MKRFSRAPVRRRLGKKGKKRASGFYWVRITDGKHRTWKTTGMRTKAEAQDVLDAWRSREIRGEAGIIDAVPFDKAATEWLEEKKESGIAPKTAIVFGTYVRAWGRHFKAKPVRSITRKDIRAYLKLRTGKLGPRSLNNELRRLSSFFKWAGEQEWVRKNPAHGIGAFIEEKKRIRALNVDEQGRLLEEAKAGGDDVYGFVLCLLASGLRRGTVGALTFDDIEWTSGEWRIPAGKMKSREPFTGRPIDPELFAYLKAHRKPSGLIFGRLDNEKWKAAVSRAGLEITPHIARKTFVTRCRRKGIAMEICMFLSDHRDLATVIECYREVGTEEAREAMAGLATKAAGGGA